MSVTLAAAIISLLPAAVGFHSHKDNVQWHFGGKKRESNGRENPLWLVLAVLNSTVGFEACSSATVHALFSLILVQNIQEEGR